MTIAVDMGRKATNKQINQLLTVVISECLSDSMQRGGEGEGEVTWTN